MGILAGAIIAGVASGVLNGAMASSSAKKNAKAYRNAAEEIKSAANKYSGANAYNALQQAGNIEGNIVNRQALDAQLQNSPVNNSATMANVADLKGDFTSGYNLGQQNKQKDLNAKYNYDTASAQAALNAANINYQAGTAAQQAAMNTAGGLTDLYKNVKSPSDATSDENCKESINNNSGLPESDIEDSMRQLETIQYKYKDASVPGCDNEVHKSGFTAQSAEKTPLFNKAVHNDPDGVKRIDKWKLLESVTAATAQLQREIDKLEKGNK